MSNIDGTILELQRQLAKTLVIQAMLPIVTCFTPGILILLTMVSPIEPPEYLAGMLGALLTYVPLESGLCMFFFVKAYRDFGIQLFKKLAKKTTTIELFLY